MLVTDSALRPALSTIRCLGRHGVRIVAVDHDRGGEEDLGGVSRYVDQSVRVPSNHTDPEGFLDAIVELAADCDVVFPIGMHSIKPVARHRDRFQNGHRIALPPWSTIERADRTRDLLALAAALDIPVPRTVTPADFETMEELCEKAPLPAIVKLGVEAGLAPGHRYRIVRTPGELRTAVSHFQSYTDAPLVQELLTGPGVGFEALYDFDSKPVAGFCHRRLRQYPLDGGPSTYCVGVRLPELEVLGRRLLDALSWIGLAMVEFKYDERTGVPKLMEINPRPWGSMELPIRSGLEFPWLVFRLARDGRVEPPASPASGVRLRFLLSDLQAARAELRRRPGWRRSLSILGSLVDPRVREGVLSFRDPRPSLVHLRKGMTRARARKAAHAS